MSIPDIMLATPAISKFLRTKKLRTDGSRKTTPKAWYSNMRSWSEPDLAPDDSRHPADRGGGGPLAVGVMCALYPLPSPCKSGTSIRVGSATLFNVLRTNAPSPLFFSSFFTHPKISSVPAKQIACRSLGGFDRAAPPPPPHSAKRI